MKTRPQQPADDDEGEHAEQAGLEPHAEREPEAHDRHAQAAHQGEVGDHQAEQQRQPPHRGEQQAVEVAVLDVDHERAGRARCR